MPRNADYPLIGIAPAELPAPGWYRAKLVKGGPDVGVRVYAKCPMLMPEAHESLILGTEAYPEQWCRPRQERSLRPGSARLRLGIETWSPENWSKPWGHWIHHPRDTVYAERELLALVNGEVKDASRLYLMQPISEAAYYALRRRAPADARKKVDLTQEPPRF